MPVSVAVAGPVDETARILRRFGVLSQHVYLNTNIKRVLFIIFQTLTPIISTWVLSQQLVLTTTNNV